MNRRTLLALISSLPFLRSRRALEPNRDRFMNGQWGGEREEWALWVGDQKLGVLEEDGRLTLAQDVFQWDWAPPRA